MKRNLINLMMVLHCGFIVDVRMRVVSKCWNGAADYGCAGYCR